MTAIVGTATDTQLDQPALYIAGHWEAPAARRPAAEVTNAADGSRLASVVQGGGDDVDRAVSAARAVLPRLAELTVAQRVHLLGALADALERRAKPVAETIALEVGTPLRLAQAIQVGLPVRVLRGYAEAVSETEAASQIGHSTVLRHPAGVVGAITPWNYPLHQAVAKFGAALAAGCAMVLKPSNVAPLSAFALAEAAEEAGIPAGALSVVTGSGQLVGEAIAGHPGVDVVSFTGSGPAGTRVAQLAARNITKVALELGGKSASIVLRSADLPAAVKASVRTAMLNSGQTCSAWTRLLVPRDLLGDVATLISRELGALTVGHPLDPVTRLGPLASAEQRQSVMGYVEYGLGQGLPALTQERNLPPGDGYYVLPVAFIDVPAGSRLATEEIFGPVLSVVGYDTVDEAVAISNDSAFGLAGAVWAADDEEAFAVASRLRTGQVDVNGAPFNPVAPFGGYRGSGIGRELGRFGIEEFLEITSIQRPPT